MSPIYDVALGDEGEKLHDFNVFDGILSRRYAPLRQYSAEEGESDAEGQISCFNRGGRLLSKFVSIVLCISVAIFALVLRSAGTSPLLDENSAPLIDETNPMPVYVLRSKDKPSFEPRCCWMLKILKEALDVSPKFSVTTDPFISSVWVVDLNELLKRAGAERMIDMVKFRLSRKHDESRSRSLRMYLLDWSDGGKSVDDSLHIDHFKNLSMLLGADNIYFAQRAGVEGRAISSNIQVGNLSDPFSAMNWGHKKEAYSKRLMGYVHGCPGHLDFTVRTDLFNEMKRQFSLSSNISFEPDNSYHEHIRHEALKRAHFDPVEIRRPKDAAHFWNASNPGQAKHVTLRNSVSRALQSMNEQHPELSLFGGEVGDRGSEGRKYPQAGYAAALLEYKIVIVCQRDTYEGHYRLFEALASGAMVMTDFSHYLPKGIKDGESLVVYKSIAEMESKMLYYLHHEKERKMIARMGYSIALGQHRSWQWLERIMKDSAWPKSSLCPPVESM
eukprot:CAMPEP_0113576646 /NCGR_PEP_ID=MMETSP0015_2-20120614/28419_1 /TAXON_ID=2838 /ORGANISM="Odontella" /LENGTH=500 /DNA_ID=CAMNT_0000480119 /DNA_START=192 /DNA_END=1694 /DNA_ORIENTATION=+ /assembly_acc=CAM_ASM_000160